MPEETPPRRPTGPEPASDAKKHANKRVVLSSVAKVAPVSETESLLGEPAPSKDGPPELPPKTSDGGLIRPVGWTTRPGGTTTIIKLPPKTGTLPRMMSLSPQARQPPPPLPIAGAPVNGEENAKRPPPIKIAPPAAPALSDQDSIFGTPPPAPPPVEARLPFSSGHSVPPPLPPRPARTVETPAPEPAPPLKSSAPPGPEKAEPHRLAHVPPLVVYHGPETGLPAGADGANVRPAPKADPLAQTVRLAPAPVQKLPAAEPTRAARTEAPGRVIPAVPPIVEAKGPEVAPTKHRLPPRSSAIGRLRPPGGSTGVPSDLRSGDVPPRVFSGTLAEPVPAKPAASTPQAVKSSVTPPTIPLPTSRVKPPTIPLRTVAAGVPRSVLKRPGDEEPVEEDEGEEGAPGLRAAKKRRRRVIGIVVFYVLLVLLLPCLYEAALYFTTETRVEGQVIPPPGMLLGDEVWIVTDFRDLAAGIADDLASDRQIVVQDMQEKLGHVQRAQADVATREARIRLLKDQVQADNDEEMSLMKQARDAAQQIWDGPGAQLEADYQSRLTTLNQAIAERAKANHLQYNPDPNYYSPEVWANAYRLALYEVPAGVDAVKERTWLDDQMKAWHDFTKAMDQKQSDLRQQAAQLKLQPASKVADLKAQVDDLQQRVDATLAEEEPLKAELEQARGDLAAVQNKEAGLDAKPYERLDALPEQNITKRLPLESNGRFSWREVEKENKYAADEKTHVFWIFARAFRPDGRQYWALNRFSVRKDSTTLLMIEPDSFISTRTILRPDLSPDDQAR